MEAPSFPKRVEYATLLASALALGAMASGCGREPSMATRSAAAYQKAMAQGLPVGSGHGGHGAEDDADHSDMAMPDTAEHEHTTGGGAHEHSEPSPEIAGANSDAMTGMDHSHTPNTTAVVGMDDGTKDEEAMSHEGSDHGHGTPVATQPPQRAPISSSELARLDPAETLVPDEFDRVAPMPSADAEQGHEDSGHEDHGTTAGPDKEVATAETGQHERPTEAMFTCPMHPEVVSTQPGTCPKCGMTLVERKKS